MVPLNLVRVLLGLLTLFFAYFLGRSIVQLGQRRMRGGRLSGWLIRFTLSLGAILWSGGVDATAILTMAGAAAAGGYGAWQEWRPRQSEDLTHKIFPEDEDQGPSQER